VSDHFRRHHHTRHLTLCTTYPFPRRVSRITEQPGSRVLPSPPLSTGSGFSRKHELVAGMASASEAPVDSARVPQPVELAGAPGDGASSHHVTRPSAARGNLYTPPRAHSSERVVSPNAAGKQSSAAAKRGGKGKGKAAPRAMATSKAKSRVIPMSPVRMESSLGKLTQVTLFLICARRITFRLLSRHAHARACVCSCHGARTRRASAQTHSASLTCTRHFFSHHPLPSCIPSPQPFGPSLPDRHFTT
jgi:hypothetical protein